MIASLRGVLAEKHAGVCVVEAGGVGYLVQVSSFTLAALPERGAEVFVRTRQIVREDSLQLFGFTDPEELELFDLLIGVSGVGPKLALALLSGMKATAVARAIKTEQIAALTTVPGIGRKTAERVIVELRDKVRAPVAGAAPRESGVLPKSESVKDAVAALVRLGYTGPQAQEALRELGDEVAELSVEDLVRRALVRRGKAIALQR